MNHESAIILKDVWKSFRDGRDQIIRGFDVSFPKGKLTFILGPSGTGKSVTLKIILGLLLPDSGQIEVLGNDLSDFEPDELIEFRQKFGMVFQNSALFDDMTIFENVAFPLREHGNHSEDEITENVTTVLKKLGLKPPYDKLPSEISGGMRKRVGIARAIVRKPDILLYDEPTTGLDPVTRLTVDDLILKIKSELNLTSVVVSHDIPAALKLADWIVFLAEGQVLFQGAPDELLKNQSGVIQEFIQSELKSYKVMKNAEQLAST